LTALAVMIGLVTAMFAVMVSAQTAPSAPEELKATAEEAVDGTAPDAVLTWTAPTLADGVAVVDYDIQYRAPGVNGGDDWRDVPGETTSDTDVGETRTLTVDNLNSDLDTQDDVEDSELHGETVDFRIRFITDETDAVEGEWSEPVSVRLGQLEDREEEGICKDGIELETDLTKDEADTAAEFCTLVYAITADTDESVIADVDGDAVTIARTGATIGSYTITAAKAGTATVTVTGSSEGIVVDDEFEITVVDPNPGAAVVEDDTVDNPAFKIDFVGDSDNVVAAPINVTIKITPAGGAELVSIGVSGGLDFYTIGDDGTRTLRGSSSTDVAAAEQRDKAGTLVLAIPAGTAEGAYVVSAIGKRDEEARIGSLVATKTLTVGTPVEVDTVSFDLSSPRRIDIPVRIAGQSATTLNPKDVDEAGGGARGDQPDNYADDASTKEPASISVGGGNSTELTLSILNANGKPAEASSITSIVISTTGGTLSENDPNPLDDDNTNYHCEADKTHACEIDISEFADAGEPVPGALRVLLSAPETPGTAVVSAIVVAGGKVFTPDSITIAFYGPADSLALGDASGTVLAHNTGDDQESDYDADEDPDKGMDARDQITFAVDAADKNGNAVRTPALSVKITDPDGVTVSNTKYETSQSGALNNKLHLDVDTAATAALASGAYTLKVTAGALSDSGDFTVVGASDSLALDVSTMAPSEVGEQITVTATVTDAGGNAVADGTTVTFTSPDKTGDTDAVIVAITSATPATKGGDATVTYVVVGDGSTVITSTVSDDATPTVNVAVIVSSAGAVADPEPEPEVVTLACLSETSGFSVYGCSTGSSASELFALVSGRGATAIHLWNGSSWVRYSVVDGTTVPGSSDFTVADDDILYISN